MISSEGYVLDKITKLPYLDDFKTICQKVFKIRQNKSVLVSLDINNFKYINRIYGYEAGDSLIRECADFFCRENPNCIIATRNYVDHFLILTNRNDEDDEGLLKRFDRLHKSFMRLMNQKYPQAVLHIHAGAYSISEDEDSISRAIDRAQIARNSIKESYQRTVAFYNEELERKVQEESRVIPTFQKALKENRLQVYLQPKFAIDSQKIVGAEALARILDEEGRILPPASFIPVLEQTGMIVELDLFVLKRVVDLLRGWLDEGRQCYPISLNLSLRDIVDEYFLENAIQYINQQKVPKETIEFELTETLFMEDVKLVSEKLKWIKAHGFRISMDDFGSGYNSLYTLGSIPVDMIKFDRGFVVNSLNTPVGRKIMAGMFHLFQEVSYDVLCEGVETTWEEQIIQQCGCNTVQGYLHDRPLPVDVFVQKYMTEI